MKAAEEASRKAAAQAEAKLQQLREQQERQKGSVGAEMEEVEEEGSNGVLDVAPSKVCTQADIVFYISYVTMPTSLPFSWYIYIVYIHSSTRLYATA